MARCVLTDYWCSDRNINLDMGGLVQTVFIDFETYYNTKAKYDLKKLSIVEYIHHPEFYVQGVAVKDDKQYTRWYSAQEIPAMLQHYDWKQTRVIAHNVKFDGAILAWKYGITPAQWVDTKAMVKATLGNSIPSASLKDAAQALGLPEKGQLNTNGKKDLTLVEQTELAEYCKHDVDLCHDIFYALLKHFPDSQWGVMDWTVRAFLEPQLIIDGKKCQVVYQASLDGKKALLEKIGVDAPVLRSNQQFAALLKSEGYKVPTKKNKDGKSIPALSIQDKEFLQLQQTSIPRLKELIEARIAVKQTLEETRAKKLYEISKISPYCFDVIFSGAQQTHRFSGGNGCAGNPQNFRRGSELRSAIKVGKGKSLVVADFSNIELRVLAFMTRDSELMDAIKKGEDLYCKFASKIYGRTITKQRDKKERMLGKAAVLGLGYGMGAEKFRRTVFAQTGELLPLDFSENVVKLYRETYRAVPKFWNTCEKVLEQIASQGPKYFPGVSFLGVEHEALVLPSGLKIRYHNLRYTWKHMFNRWKKEWVYDRYKSKATQLDKTKIYGGMVTENLCQGLAGDICKLAIQRLIEYGFAPSGQVHDELLVVCDEKDVEAAQECMVRAMTDAIPWWPELPLQVEIAAGRNWLECK